MRSAMVPILSWCSAANSIRSGRRAMLPSSRMISHSTAAGFRPARRGVLFGVRHAHQAAAVLGEEVDLVGRDELGAEHQVALVLAILVVDQDDDAAGADLRDDLGNRADGSGFAAHQPILLLRLALGAAGLLTDARRLAGARAPV